VLEIRKIKPKTMKRHCTVFILVLLCIGMKVIAETENDCYVKVGDKIYFGKDIKMGLLHTEIVLPDGTVTEVRNRDITAYKHHNRIYRLMPVICEKNDTICLAMMEYITSRTGYSVFRYCCPISGDQASNKKDFYFVYKQGKFYRRISPEDAEAQLPAFGIKVI
jgi:hypothetical protein